MHTIPINATFTSSYFPPSSARIAPSARRPKEDRSILWSDLMARAQAGDARAYNRLLREMSEWLRGYFHRRLSLNSIDDAIQETLAAVHNARHSYDPARPIRPWLATIARHKWIDILRSMSRDMTQPIDDEAELFGVPDHGSKVRSAIVLRESLARLSTAQANAIRLTKIEGASIAEASRITGQSVSLVKVNVHRGLRQIARLLECHTVN